MVVWERKKMPSSKKTNLLLLMLSQTSRNLIAPKTNLIAPKSNLIAPKT